MISEERIGKLLNDASEGYKTGTVNEWRQIAVRRDLELCSIRHTMIAFSLAEQMREAAVSEAKRYLSSCPTKPSA